MYILLVDNNLSTCEELIKSVKTLFPNEPLSFFSDPLLAIKHGINNPVDLLISPFGIDSINSEDITRILRNHHSKLYSVYLTNKQKIKTSFTVEPDSIITLPVTVEKLKNSIKGY